MSHPHFCHMSKIQFQAPISSHYAGVFVAPSVSVPEALLAPTARFALRLLERILRPLCEGEHPCEPTVLVHDAYSPNLVYAERKETDGYGKKRWREVEYTTAGDTQGDTQGDTPGDTPGDTNGDTLMVNRDDPLWTEVNSPAPLFPHMWRPHFSHMSEIDFFF